MSIDDIIRMARECGNWSGQTVEMNDVGLEKFAKLVAAAERNKVAQWMIARSYATGHGDTVDDLLKELEWQVKEREREVCAQVCDDWPTGRDDVYSIGKAIRARGKR